MKIYLIALGAGLLVGIFYAFIHVRSPAPPAVALIGLLGMLVGEQVVPTVKRYFSPEPVSVSWLKTECLSKIAGVHGDPGHHIHAAPATPKNPDDHRGA